MKKKSAGFSLIELIMVVAIFIIISAIILSKQSKFSSDILISNVAYQVALSIREAQVYGIGAKQIDVSTNSIKNFQNFGYGINLEVPGSAKADHFLLFADNLSSANQYMYDEDDGDADETNDDVVVQTITLPQGQKIHDFCAREGSWRCWSEGNIHTLDITFLKPNSEPNIKADGSDATDAFIMVESSIGDKCRTIFVSSTGQINVDPPDPSLGCDVGTSISKHT